MSFIISIVGWQTNERSVEIYQKQLELQQEQSEIQQVQLELQQEQSEQQSEIQQAQLKLQQQQSEMQQAQLELQTNDREPYFTIYEQFDEKDYSSKKYYIVKNEGGKINNGVIKNIDAILTIYYSGNDGDIYYCKIDGLFLFENSVLSIYDENNKEFVFHGYDYFVYYNFEDNLETELKSIYGSENIFITLDFYLTMRFTDYKNKEHERTYSFTPFNIEHVDYDYTEGKIFLGSTEYGTDTLSIVYDISKKIENFKQ